MKKGPLPIIEFEGVTYKLRNHNITVPDFTAMSHLHVMVWLNQNTIAKGRFKEKVVLPNLDISLK